MQSDDVEEIISPLKAASPVLSDMTYSDTRDSTSPRRNSNDSSNNNSNNNDGDDDDDNDDDDDDDIK